MIIADRAVAEAAFSARRRVSRHFNSKLTRLCAPAHAPLNNLLRAPIANMFYRRANGSWLILCWIYVTTKYLTKGQASMIVKV